MSMEEQPVPRKSRASASKHLLGRYFDNDLLYTWFDNTGDERMTRGVPYKEVLQFFRGNLNSGTTVNTAGGQTATAFWTGNDDPHSSVGFLARTEIHLKLHMRFMCP